MIPDNESYCTTLKNLVGDDDPLAILSETPARITSMLTGVDGTFLHHRPAPEKWSISQIVAHLADSEVVFGFRLRMVLSANGVSLQAFDPDAWASTFAYESCDVHTSAHIFSAMRMATLRMVRQSPTPRFDNTGNHEEWGSTTARDMIVLEAGHDRNHLRQIENILAAAGMASTFRPGEQKPEVPLDLADKVDLRVGTIVDIVPIPEVNRLMKLTVDFGSERRTVIAGIREERADPRVLVGRQALFYYNLPRKKIRGHLSEAMLCDLGYADGIIPALLEPEWPVPNGTRAG
jgi:methionine--tRNA ligase beta chain